MLTWVALPVDDDEEGPLDEELKLAAARDTELRKMFALYDCDGNGKISPAEFKAGLRSGGWSDEELEEIFCDTDASRDGWIDFEEFTHLMVLVGN